MTETLFGYVILISEEFFRFYLSIILFSFCFDGEGSQITQDRV